MKISFRPTILLFSLILVLCSCNQAEQKDQAINETKVDETVKQDRYISNISVHQIRNILDYRKSDYVMIDVRTEEEFKEGHIPNSQNADVLKADIFKQQIKDLERDSLYYVYCQSGRRSLTAFNTMVDMGFTRVSNVVGGYEAWLEMEKSKK